MNIIKSLAIAAGIAGLAACAGGGEENNAANMDANLTDMNAGMDMNTTVNAADGMNSTENAVVNDLTTNDADANLANGT